MFQTENTSPVPTTPGSITGSSKYNSAQLLVLASNVDTLEANTYSPLIPGLVEYLLAIREEMEPGQESSSTTLVFDGQSLLLSQRRAGAYAFYLCNDSCQVRLERGGVMQDRNITAKITLASSYLWRTDLASAIRELRQLGVQLLGEDGAATLAPCRVDLARDFQGFGMHISEYSEFRERLVARGRPRADEEHGHRVNAITIGRRNALQVQIYNKSLEIEKSGKRWLLDLYAKTGKWDGSSVWRLECRFFSEGLREFRTEQGEHVTLESLPALLGSLWNYATHQWCRHTEPTAGDTNRSRWPLSALWRVLAADFQCSGSLTSLSRVREREWKADRLLVQIVGCAKSVSALLGGEDSPMLTMWRLKRAIEDDQRRKGMSFEESVRRRRSEMMIPAA